MNYYRLGEKDQSRSSWVLFECVKPLPKHKRRPELPPVMYQFFGPDPEGEMRLKARYVSLCCKICGRYDDDPVFEAGFEDPVIIRIQGDFAHTQDRVFVISDRFLTVLRKAKVRGYETKPIGTSAWHAFRATERVSYLEGVMKPQKPFCPQCGRSNGTIGVFEHLNQLTVPRQPNTIFTTKKGWATLLWDRWIFLTEDVVQALKDAGIKGGYCNRLWTDEEVRKAKEKAKQGIRWKPPKSIVLL